VRSSRSYFSQVVFCLGLTLARLCTLACVHSTIVLRRCLHWHVFSVSFFVVCVMFYWTLCWTESVETYAVRYTKPSRFSLTSLTVSCVYKTGHAASSSYDNNQPSLFSLSHTYPLAVPCPYDGITPVPTVGTFALQQRTTNITSRQTYWEERFLANNKI
jgi:hypothetical protein